jgi:anaerobic selenocysteine-containing dehydrogenase
MLEFCENGVKAIADEATTKRINSEFFNKHGISNLTQRSDYWFGLQGRLTEPMVKRPNSDHYEAISWDQAFQLLATELNSLTSPNEAAFYTSGRTSNEAAFLYQLFVRQYGTNNLPDCSHMCHESSGTAMSDAIGIGKGCVTLDDFEKTDAIFIIGQKSCCQRLGDFQATLRSEDIFNPRHCCHGTRKTNRRDCQHSHVA